MSADDEQPEETDQIGLDDEIPLLPHDPEYGVRFPDLRRVPKDRWVEALRPLSHRHRTVALNRGVRSPWEWGEMAGILSVLDLEDQSRRQRAASVVPELPVARVEPGGLERAGRGGRQVGFRLGKGQYADLQEAAKLSGVAPATLARMLTMRGVTSALLEWRREAS